MLFRFAVVNSVIKLREEFVVTLDFLCTVLRKERAFVFLVAREVA